MLVDVKGHVALSGTVKEGCCRGEEAVEQMTSTPFLNSIYAFLRDEQRVLLAADATDRSIFFLSRTFSFTATSLLSENKRPEHATTLYCLKPHAKGERTTSS